MILAKEMLPGLNGSASASLLSVMPSLAGVRVIIYDETLGDGEDLPSKYARIRCIRKVLRRRSSSAVVSAIREITG